MFKRDYHNLNLIEISAKQLVKNYHYLESKAKTKVAPVLKSNAYGHGICLVAKILEKENPPFFCVDSLFEAYQLLKAGIKTQILIMGYVHPESLKTKKLPFSFAVSTLETLQTIKRHQPHAPVHIFVDTGMHREGVLLKDLPKFVKKCNGLKIEGLMSHFGVGGDKTQIANFLEAREIVKAAGILPKYFHLANTDGIFALKNHPEIANIARSGLGLYKNTLIFKSTIVQIKNLEKGDKVGYDFTYTAPKKMKIGIVCAGYNDGVDRKLSNIPPFIGRISMNICAVNMAKFPKAKVGEQIILPVQNKLLFPYETLIHLNPTTKRLKS